jgi:WD40 repeat protein
VGYLQANSFVRDITGQIKKSGEATRHEISAQTIEIVASNERLAQEFGNGFDAVNGTLEMGFQRLESALSNVDASIDSLRADFNYNMGLLLDRLQIQNQLIFGVLERLDAIHKTLERPELTKAREFYNRGCERLSKGLLDKALEAFLEAEKKNDTNFFTQFQIGKLYLYGINEYDNVIDLAKAERHLRNATRYGKAEISVLSEFRRWTGEALLHASVACYAQANDLRINGNTTEANEFIFKAFHLAQQACEIYPSLSENQYHLAKYAALLGDVETSVQSLEKAVSADVNYCLKAEFDSDFDEMRAQVFALFERLRLQSGEKALRRLHEYSQKYITDMVYSTDEAKKGKEEISNLLSNAEIKISKNTLFDIYEALQLMDQVESIFLTIYNLFVERYSIEHCSYRDISSDGKIATWDEDNRIAKVWGSDGKLLFKLSEDAGCSFSPDGKLISTWASHNENVKVWQVTDGKLIQTLPDNRYGGLFSPDGKLISTWNNGIGKLFQVSDGELINTLPGYGGSFSPDGKLIATMGTENVKLFQVSDGELIQTVPEKNKFIPDGYYHGSFSPDGKLIVIFDGENTRLFQVSDGKLIQTFPGGNLGSFSPDGKVIVICDRETVKLFQVSDGKLIQTLPEKKFVKFIHDGNFIITSDGYLMIDCTLTIWSRQVIPKKDFDQQEHFGKSFVAVMEEKNRERERQVEDINVAAAAAEQHLLEERRRKGLCLVCGAKLSFFDKLRGRTTCPKHLS